MLPVPNIFNYTDYRVYLKEAYHSLKAADKNFNYRNLARRVGYKSPAFFTLIIKGDRNISLDMARQFGAFLSHTARQQQYFELLVLADQAATQNLKKKYIDKALQLKSQKLKTKEIGSHIFYRKWYYSAVRELIEVLDFKGDFAFLATQVTPSITAWQAQEAVKKLQQIGLITIDAEGVYRQAENLISPGPEVTEASLAQFQMATCQLAEQAINRRSPEAKTFVTQTMSISESSYVEIVQKLREVRKEIMEIAKKDTHPDRVYHINYHVFPMSKRRKK